MFVGEREKNATSDPEINAEITSKSIVNKTAIIVSKEIG